MTTKPKNAEPELSPKSTKQEILDAYNDLLEKIQNQQNPQQKREKEEKEAIVIKAASNSKDGLFKKITDLKIQVNQTLEEVGDSLQSEFRQLSEIREAISIEKKNLEDIYQIHANADSMAAMLMAQQEKRRAFEEEMTLQKDEWEMEKAEMERQLKEQKETLTRDRKRDEEEYKYTLTLKRKKEQDIYEEQKLLLEKELGELKSSSEKEFKERELSLTSKEAELEDLRKKVGQFPDDLNTAVKNTEKTIDEKLTQQYEIEKKIFLKETETELKLKDQSIQTLETKVKELELYIKQLTTKAETAEKTVKDIAIKAIESASKVQLFESSSNRKDRKEE